VKKLVHQDWEKRWHKENQRLGRIVQPGTDLGKRLVVPEDTLPTAQVLKLHEELRKAESALLTQACTKRIGLAEFLHRHKVPGFLTATCQYRAGHETLQHMALFCTFEADRRRQLQKDKKRTYTQMVGTKDRAKQFVQ
jgi:hypothetical protein